MATVPPRTERRRARPGSVLRPVNGRLYRGTWILVGLPLLVTAFSVARPTPLPRAFLPAFDGNATRQLASDLVTSNDPNRSPGRLDAADWFREQLAPYGLRVRTERFSAVIPGRGRVELQNLVAEAVGPAPGTIVVMAHRDNDGTGPGANDNASGTAMLVQLARAYGSPPGVSSRLHPNHTILFLSTDGGAFGGLGAAWFVAHSPGRHDVAAVINLDAVGGTGPVRLQFNGDTPRTPSGTFLETIAARVAAQIGHRPGRPSALDQLIDLGFPFSLYEQAPFIAKGIAAVTITTAGDKPPNPVTDTLNRVSAGRLGQIGRAAQDTIGTLDQGLEFAQGTSSYVYIGSRLVRGWAVELVLIACLLPFLATAIDLFAHCRRRRIPLAPALRAYRSRLGFWAWTIGLFELFALVGVWPGGAARPIAPSSGVAHDWPARGLLGLGVLVLIGWFVTRERLLPRRAVTAEEELAGHTVSLLCLGVLSLLVVGTNPFALLFLLPTLHVWLWLPQVRDAPLAARFGVLAVGLAGPALLLGSFAARFGLGWDALWYLAELRAINYVPFVVMPFLVIWLAATSQLAALAVHRYAPYPAAAELPPRGPLRRAFRAAVVGVRTRRRRASEDAAEALEG